jgi:hypothetical protein
MNGIDHQSDPARLANLELFVAHKMSRHRKDQSSCRIVTHKENDPHGY